MDDFCEATGKRKFRSEHEARRGMRRIAIRLRVYLCEHCRYFHMTKGENYHFDGERTKQRATGAQRKGR